MKRVKWLKRLAGVVMLLVLALVSALYGIAIGKGLVEVHRTLAELGVDDAKPPLSDQEKQARLVDLLTARSGIYHH